MNLNLIIVNLFFAHQQEASYFRKEVKFRYLLLEMKDKSVFFQHYHAVLMPTRFLKIVHKCCGIILLMVKITALKICHESHIRSCKVDMKFLEVGTGSMQPVPCTSQLAAFDSVALKLKQMTVTTLSSSIFISALAYFRLFMFIVQLL